MSDQLQLPHSRRHSRRTLLKAAIGTLAGLMAVWLGFPLVASLVGPAYRRKTSPFRRVIRLDELPTGEPRSVSFNYLGEEAYVPEQQTHDVWVIKHSASEVTVFSPVCPHLSCHYDWNKSSGRFVCPCHGSVFSVIGEVLAGPSPRPLDTLPHRIENGQLFVEWETFKPGIGQKVRT